MRRKKSTERSGWAIGPCLGDFFKKNVGAPPTGGIPYFSNTTWDRANLRLIKLRISMKK